MLSQTDAVKKAWAATDRTLDIIVTIDGKDYQATEINSLNYDAGAFTGDTLGIGSAYENSVTIEFSSVVEAFKQGLTVLPKVGILVNGKFEYTKLGTFIMSEVNRDRNNNLTTIKALDQMCKLEGQYKPTVGANAELLDVIADIANQGGVTVNEGELQHLPSLPNIKRIEGQTLRTAIGWVAQLYDGFAAFDRDGKLTIRTTASPDYTITPGEYQQGGLTKNEVAYKTGGIKVTVNTKKTDDSGQEVDDTTTLQAGETTGSQIELTNDSMTSDLLTTVWTGIKDITYYPYTLNWFGNPNLEAGDWVTLTDTQGNKFNVPVNQYTMSFNGGLESTISATQSSSTAGGYAYTGSAGSIKNMIEALQVRHTASGNNIYPPSYQGQPQNPKKGDVWYKQNGNNIEVWIYQEEDGKLSWVRTPLDGEVKAELQAMGKKTDEDLTRVKSELSSEAESQWQSAKTATSEADQRLTSLQAENNASLAELHETANSLHAVANSLHANADSMRSSLTAATSELGKDITSTRNSLDGVRNSLSTATSEVGNDLANARNSLVAVDADLRNGIKQANNDITAAKASLTATGNSLVNQAGSLSTATSETAKELASTRNSLVAVDADLRNGIKQANNDITAAKTSLTATGNSLANRAGSLATATSELQRQTGQISGSLSTADSMIMYNSNAIAEVKRTAGEISTTVSNIRVGGRNLLRNTKTLNGVWNGATETVDGFTVVKATQSKAGRYDPIAWNGLTTIKSNTDYTLTFYAKASKATGFYSYMYNIGAGDTVSTGYMDGSTKNYLTTDYKRYVVHFHTAAMPTGRTVNCLPLRLIEQGVTAWIYGVQLEEGNTATQWQPNPADTDQAISKISQTADAIRADLTNTKGDVATVKATANSLQSQITDNKNNISSVKQTADSLTSTVGQMPAKWQQAINDKASAQVLDSNVDMNNLTTAGTYLIRDFSVKNAPFGAWFMATVDATEDHTRVVQRVKKDDSNVVYERSNMVAGWTAWERIATGTDISSINQTMDSITTRVSNAEGNVSGLQQTAKSIQASVSDNAKSISSVKQTADSLATRMTNAEGSVSNLKQTASGLQTDVADANKNISSVQQKADSLTTRMSNAEGNVSSLQQTAKGLQFSVTNAQGDISSLQQTASQLTSDMKDAKGNISNLQSTASGLTSDMKNANKNISSIQQTADRLSGVVGDANSGLVSSVNAIPGKISSAITASKQATVIASAVDLHNMTTAGYYLLKGTLTNSPVDAWAFLRVVTSDSGDRIYHRIWKDNASTVYTEEWTGSWSDWATHINSDNLKSNVITAINQSTEGVSITGAKITLDGNVNVAPGFTLSADRITAGTLSADRISGGTLNFSNITVNGLTANSISSGSISGQNLNINLDNGTVEFTKGNLHSTDGGFNISIDNKSFYLDMGSGSKLWIDNNGFHLQESATQHLWMNKDGLHNYTDANGNGLWINDTELRVLNSSNAGLVAKDGILQFSANPIWNSDNVYSGTLNDQIYGTIGFNSNLLSSSLNGIFIKGREGVVIGTSSYGGGSLFGADGFLDVGQAGSGINLPDDLNKPASLFTKSALTLLGGPTYPAFWGMSDKARVCIGCDTYYTHNGASMVSGGNDTRGNNISINARNTNIIGYDWVNIHCRNGRIALDAQWVHSYPTYNHTTSAGANVYVAEDGALIRSSSARKYKTDIQDANNAYGEKLIEFAPKKWIDKAEKKRYEEDPENNKKPGYYYGLIADDLDAAGLDMLVNYGAEGEVEGINYDRLAVALLPVIKSLKDQVASLKEQIKALTK